MRILIIADECGGDYRVFLIPSEKLNGINLDGIDNNSYSPNHEEFWDRSDISENEKKLYEVSRQIKNLFQRFDNDLKKYEIHRRVELHSKTPCEFDRVVMIQIFYH